MDFKALRFQILNGSPARRLLLRAFLIALALSMMPLVQNLYGYHPVFFNPVGSIQCGARAPFVASGTNLINKLFFKPIWGAFDCEEDVNGTTDVIRELMAMKMIDREAQALCVGKGSASAMRALQELGFVNACGVPRNPPFFSLKHRKFVYELAYADNSIDFVLSGDIDRISVPAILVLEIERVLKPGGIGVMLVDAGHMDPNSLIRSATPVSSLLKTSTVVHVGYVHESTMVVFRKKTFTAAYFAKFPLPADCPSVMNNKPLLEHLEPLNESNQSGLEQNVTYLSNLVDMDSRKRLVYIDIGAGENLNSGSAGWLIPSYPIDQNAFNVYIVDHNTSALLSCVKKPGVTFIYYPGLVGDDTVANMNHNVGDLPPYPEDKEFDFLSWFKETVQYADFVVLKMKAGDIEVKFLTDLFESGAICFVDELFLACSDNEQAKGGVPEGECIDLFQSLRSNGVFVHQW